MIKVILNGCNGKMGRVISQIAKTYNNLTIVAGVDKGNSAGEYPIYNSIELCTEAADVILDFSRPDALNSLIKYAKEHSCALILCTTGYNAEQLKTISEESLSIPIFRSANMSIGINVINNILKSISSLLYKDFDIEIIEKHHNQKVDAPSGTALLLANTIKSSIEETTSFIYGREGNSKRTENEIGIHTVRGGNIVGDHEIIFAGHGEVIELKHSAISREVFAVGALRACEFMCGKVPGMYSMDNVINE